MDTSVPSDTPLLGEVPYPEQVSAAADYVRTRYDGSSYVDVERTVIYVEHLLHGQSYDGLWSIAVTSSAETRVIDPSADDHLYDQLRHLAASTLVDDAIEELGERGVLDPEDDVRV